MITAKKDPKTKKMITLFIGTDESVVRNPFNQNDEGEKHHGRKT
jgi:hypothetical protein